MADENQENVDQVSTINTITAALSATTGKSTRRSKRNSDSGTDAGSWENFANYGMHSESSLDLIEDSLNLCEELLTGEEKPSMFPCYPEAHVFEVLENIKDENETRLHMMITPWIIPSAENLARQSLFAPELSASELFADRFDAEWLCTVLGSTKPKPDYAVGLSSSIFDSGTMLANLEKHNHPDTPFRFTKDCTFRF